jgi:uncharacterized LabA/DUF88 family protein
MAKRQVHPDIVKRLAQKLLDENKNPSFKTKFVKECFRKNGKTAKVTILWDLYNSFLPTQAELHRFFNLAKDKVRDVDAKLYEKIKGLRPSAGEYCIFADVIDGHVREMIERRVLRDAGKEYVEYSEFAAKVPRDIAEDDKRLPELSEKKLLRVDYTNELFYAPFDQDALVKRLEAAYGQGAGENVQNMAVIEALQGRVRAYGERRDYQFYNQFAERLQPNEELRRRGFNQIFIDTNNNQLKWSEKQVDCGLAVRAMELLYEENITYIAINARDADLLPVFRQFGKRDQPYFLIHIKPVHKDTFEDRSRSVARAYRNDPSFDSSRVINIEMADLAQMVFKRIRSMLLDRALYDHGEYEEELEANRPIYDVLQGVEHDEYEIALKAEREAYEAHQWEMYNAISQQGNE